MHCRRALALFSILCFLVPTLALPVAAAGSGGDVPPDCIIYLTEIEEVTAGGGGNLIIWWEDKERPSASEVHARMTALGWTAAYQGSTESVVCGAPQGDFSYYYSDGQGEAPPP